mmetsp:Transcript_50213/g.74548  ORF Transcript_50213/g.74548 Transcript_50213/m.74548 type:complete len:93 (+) Transcript_50213:2140-2418(+)
MVTTIAVGQLIPLVNAAPCMLDFINNSFTTFTSYVSFFIEFSGLLHSVYLFQIGSAAITGHAIYSKESPRNACTEPFLLTPSAPLPWVCPRL